MLNYIWLALLLAAVFLAGWNGQWKEVTDKSLEMAKVAVVDIALPLAGIMALWLGAMRLAERAGLVSLLARALRPVLRRLFPDVPPEHPAMGSMVMNMAANILGLGNAATPLGLRAMKDLASLNPRPGTATNAMCTFLAINTGSIQLIPVTAIAILAANNAAAPTAIVGTALVATACGAATAITMAKLLERLPWFRLPPVPPPSATSGGSDLVGGNSARDGAVSPGGEDAGGTRRATCPGAEDNAPVLPALPWGGGRCLACSCCFLAACS